MAAGQLSPRQKMVNLMYLVFLAMIALQVSAEVLQGYADVVVSTDSSIVSLSDNNEGRYLDIEAKAGEDDTWISKHRTAMVLKENSADLYNHIEMIIEEATEGSADYSKMDKSEKLDNIFFGVEGISEAGQEFVDKIITYNTFATQTLEESPRYIESIKHRFFTGDVNDQVVNAEGLSQGWLSWAYELQPLVGSLAKLKLLQNNIKITESEILNGFFERQLKISVEEKTEELNDEIDLSKSIKPSITLTNLNVLYRGIENNLEIYLPGVHPKEMHVRGARRVGTSQYVVTPNKGKTHEIKVSGVLSDGTGVERVFNYKIKEIPKASSLVSKRADGSIIPRSRLNTSTVTVEWLDFPFDVKAKVTSFRVSIPGYPSVLVEGDKITPRAVKLINRARKGTLVRISDINAELIGNSSMILKNPASVTVTLP